MSNSLWPYGLCGLPGFSCPWHFPGKEAWVQGSTGAGCHFLLQGIFPTQRLNLCLLHLLHWQVDSLHSNHLRNLLQKQQIIIIFGSVPLIQSITALYLTPVLCHWCFLKNGFFHCGFILLLGSLLPSLIFH